VVDASDRVAIVTGGASGIGKAICQRLSASMAGIAIFDINGDLAESVASELSGSRAKALGRCVDITQRSQIEAAVQEVVQALGAPTVLINNAGIAAFQPFLDITFDEWDRQLRVNLTGTYLCCQVLIPHMLEQGWGRIVNISSSSVHSGARKQAHYVAAKAGVVGLTKSLALEFAPYGITVNTIPPGFIDTPLLRQADREGALSIEEQVARTPVGRHGEPEDVAAACAFLVSEDAGYITGQILGVNGGRNT
jgi:NAD(P)-dependent dehydrogenase (short-subunit alcohol dehydrogenase family)